jgi:lysophospholipase L1-like esterase
MVITDRRVGLVLTALLLVTTAAMVVSSSPSAAHESGRRLVSLGDSYASGLGTRTYFEASGSCKRSPYAYPVLDARGMDARLTFVACAGATIDEVLRDQLPALTSATTDVTLTAGGNDAGFRSVIIACAPPRWASDCHGAIDSAQAYIAKRLPAQLNALYRAVRSRAPAGHVVVVGYPRLFDGEDCNAGTWFSPAEQSRINATADLLDELIARRAAAHGFGFADPRAPYIGHSVCAPREWINGLSEPLTESYHPNRLGQRAYADLVRRALG